MAKAKSKLATEKPPLREGIREWLATSTEISGVGGLAAALGEPSESFRVRLSRDRWSRKILKRLLDVTKLAGSVEGLRSKYEFEITERTRDDTGARVKYDLHGRIDKLTADDPDEPKARRVLNNARLSDKEIAYITACRMTQKPIKPEFDTLKEGDNSTLILIWNLPQDPNANPAFLNSMHAKLYDPTFQQKFLAEALNKKTDANFHFLMECPKKEKTDDDKEKALKSYLDSMEKTFREKLNAVQGSGKLNWYVHFFDSEILIDVFDYCWIHLVPPVHQVGWVLFDNEELRGRLQNVDNPWQYTTLAAPISKEVIARTLKRLGYGLDYKKTWTFTPDVNKRQYSLGGETQ